MWRFLSLIVGGIVHADDVEVEPAARRKRMRQRHRQTAALANVQAVIRTPAQRDGRQALDEHA